MNVFKIPKADFYKATHGLPGRSDPGSPLHQVHAVTTLSIKGIAPLPMHGTQSSYTWAQTRSSRLPFSLSQPLFPDLLTIIIPKSRYSLFPPFWKNSFLDPTVAHGIPLLGARQYQLQCWHWSMCHCPRDGTACLQPGAGFYRKTLDPILSFHKHCAPAGKAWLSTEASADAWRCELMLFLHVPDGSLYTITTRGMTAQALAHSKAF